MCVFQNFLVLRENFSPQNELCERVVPLNLLWYNKPNFRYYVDTVITISFDTLNGFWLKGMKVFLLLDMLGCVLSIRRIYFSLSITFLQIRKSFSCEKTLSSDECVNDMGWGAMMHRMGFFTKTLVFSLVLHFLFTQIT